MPLIFIYFFNPYFVIQEFFLEVLLFDIYNSLFRINKLFNY